jgi:hypothetical protein
MTAEAIAAAQRGRRVGKEWLCYCPVHEAEGKPHHPSLSVTQRGGKILLMCRAGCSQRDVIAALRARGLWPERERPEWTPADRVRLAREYAEARRIRLEASYFADAAMVMVEWALDELGPTHPERAAHTALIAALRVSPEAEYRAWGERNPTWAAALVEAGRERAKRLQIGLVHWIVAEVANVA